MVETKKRSRRSKSKMRASRHSRLGGNITTQVTMQDGDALKITYMNDDDLENTINVLATYMFKKMGRNEKIDFLSKLNGF